jgi:hypothetical protein
MPKIAHIIASVFLLSILFACEFYHDEESAYITILNPKDSSYSAGDSLSITWESSGITDSVTIEMRNEDTSLPQFSFPAPSNGTYKIKIEPNMISNKKWQILVSDKANRFLFGLSKMFTVKCPDFTGPVLYPDDNIYASGERIFVYWDSTYMSDSVTIDVVCVDNTALPGYSFSAISNEICALDIDSKIASDKNWQIVVTDKKNKAISVKSKTFLVKNDTLIPKFRKSYWWLYKYSYIGAYGCATGNCYPDKFYNTSNFPEYVQIKTNEIYRWTSNKDCTDGYSFQLYKEKTTPIGSRLFLGIVSAYDLNNSSIDSLFLLNNNILQRIHLIDRSALRPSAPTVKSIFYYSPLTGQTPPVNWSQKLRTDSTLMSDIPGDWVLFKFAKNDSIHAWADDSIKYKLTLSNNNAIIYYNNTQLLTFAFTFRNHSLNFYDPLLKIDTLENIAFANPTCDCHGDFSDYGNVSDNLDTLVYLNTSYCPENGYGFKNLCYITSYYFKRVQHY